MDIILDLFDDFMFDSIYDKLCPLPPANVNVNGSLYTWPVDAGCWERDNIWRQTTTLYLLTWILGTMIYLACASFSYAFIFDKSCFAHPKFLKSQVKQEIKQALIATPIIAVFTVPFFLLEIRGYSKLYGSSAEGPGRWYDFAQVALFLMFTDFAIYWVHRFLHHPIVYKYIHKPHHKWIVPTPYASVAFHPVDGFLQSLPYHVFPFLLPLHKYTYLVLFGFVQVWTVVIHDGELVSESEIINGAACHTIHHLYFNYNYGQFTTLWDRIGGSYRQPDEEFVRSMLCQSKPGSEKQKAKKL